MGVMIRRVRVFNVFPITGGVDPHDGSLIFLFWPQGRYLPANMDDDDDGIIFPPKTAGESNRIWLYKIVTDCYMPATRTKVVPAKGNATRLPVNRPCKPYTTSCRDF